MARLSTQEAWVHAGGRRAFNHMVRLGLVEPARTAGRARWWDTAELDEGLRALPAARVREAEGRKPRPLHCAVDGCGRRLADRKTGMCSLHYKRHIHRADPGRFQVARANGQLRRGVPPAPSPLSPYRVLARTCRRCGTLNTTPLHLIRKNAGPLPRCSGCAVRYTTERHRRLMKEDEDYRRRFQNYARPINARLVARWQQQTRESATRNGYEWTGPELETIARGDLTARQSALLLGRTLAAVQRQRHLMKENPRKARLAGLATPEADRARP